MQTFTYQQNTKHKITIIDLILKKRNELIKKYPLVRLMCIKKASRYMYIIHTI